MANAPEVIDEFILEVLDDIVKNEHSSEEQLKWIKAMLRDAWVEGARMAYDLASDDIGAWDNLLEFPEELPDVAKNPYE